MTIVSEDMVEAALRYLSENTAATAKAKADRVMAEHERKMARARLFLTAPDGPIAAKEAWAEAHEDYDAACCREADAVQADEYHRAARTKAEAILEAWKCEAANIRAAERIR